jgi:DNA-binding NtrC family response regulator
VQSAEKTMPPIRILCVDDDPRINELNEIILKRAGYDVELATAPDGALELFKTKTFDLVVTDLFSTDSSDAAFVKKLRDLLPHLPVVVVSGNHHPSPEILKLADAFVMKAYSLNALTDAVREVLTRDKLRRIG